MAIVLPEALCPVVASTLVSVISGMWRIPVSALIAFLWAALAFPGESTIFFMPLILTNLINYHGNHRGFWDSSAVGPFIIGQK